MHTILTKAATGLFTEIGRKSTTDRDDDMAGLARRAATALQKVIVAGTACYEQCRAVPAARDAGGHMAVGDLSGARDHADRVAGAVLACDRPCPVEVSTRRALDDLTQFARLDRLVALRGRQTS